MEWLDVERKGRLGNPRDFGGTVLETFDLVFRGREFFWEDSSASSCE